MKTLDKGEEKLQKICDILRRETLEPAQQEAENIIAEAKSRAEQIIHDAHRQAEAMTAEAQRLIEQRNNVFQSSLEQASKQSLEALRQLVEQRLFNEQFNEIVTKQMSDPKIIADLIKAMIKALEKEGMAFDLTAFIPAHASVKEINLLLGQEILNKLKEKSVVLGDFAGGAKLKLEKQNITLDITSADLAEVLRRFIRKDFRKMFFDHGQER